MGAVDLVENLLETVRAKAAQVIQVHTAPLLVHHTASNSVHHTAPNPVRHTVFYPVHHAVRNRGVLTTCIEAVCTRACTPAELQRRGALPC